MLRDSQRKRVYGWETAVEGGGVPVTLNELRSYPDEFVAPPGRAHDLKGVFCQRTECEIWCLAHKLRRQGRLWRMPEIVFCKNHLRSSAYFRWEHKIILPPWAMNYWVFTHEMVHAILPFWVESHGPEFVGLLMYLMHRNCDVPLDYMQDLAVKKGVRFKKMRPRDIRLLRPVL